MRFVQVGLTVIQGKPSAILLITDSTASTLMDISLLGAG